MHTECNGGCTNTFMVLTQYWLLICNQTQKGLQCPLPIGTMILIEMDVLLKYFNRAVHKNVCWATQRSKNANSAFSHVVELNLV